MRRSRALRDSRLGDLEGLSAPPRDVGSRDQEVMDTFDQVGAVSLPCWTLERFLLDPELVRMNRQIPYRRGPSTTDIRCGDPRHKQCIGPDFRLDL